MCISNRGREEEGEGERERAALVNTFLVSNHYCYCDGSSS